MARPAIMTSKPMALPEHELLARVFRTLSDPSRLRMLELLVEQGEMTQSELIDQVGVVQSRASEHLACLVWCGFVESERSGRSVRYQVVDDRAIEFLHLARTFLSDNATALGSCSVLAE
jgi:ArsR family transcriptional regulator, cadmium/lead-responsive transcriptional repressor